MIGRRSDWVFAIFIPFFSLWNLEVLERRLHQIAPLDSVFALFDTLVLGCVGPTEWIRWLPDRKKHGVCVSLPGCCVLQCHALVFGHLFSGKI